MKRRQTVVILATHHGPLKSWVLPTEKLPGSVTEAMRDAAEKHNMKVYFYSVDDTGIEQVKWDIEHINDTKLD